MDYISEVSRDESLSCHHHPIHISKGIAIAHWTPSHHVVAGIHQRVRVVSKHSIPAGIIGIVSERSVEARELMYWR